MRVRCPALSGKDGLKCVTPPAPAGPTPGSLLVPLLPRGWGEPGTDGTSAGNCVSEVSFEASPEKKGSGPPGGGLWEGCEGRLVRLRTVVVADDFLDGPGGDPVAVPALVGAPGPELGLRLPGGGEFPQLRDLGGAGPEYLPGVVFGPPEPPHPDEGGGPGRPGDEIEGEVVPGKREDPYLSSLRLASPLQSRP